MVSKEHGKNGSVEARNRPVVRRQTTTPGSTGSAAIPREGEGGDAAATDGCADSARPRKKGKGVGAGTLRQLIHAFRPTRSALADEGDRRSVFSRCASSASCCSQRKTSCGSPQPPFQRTGDSDLPSAVGPHSIFRSTHQRRHWALTDSRPCANMRRFIQRLAHLRTLIADL